MNTLWGEVGRGGGVSLDMMRTLQDDKLMGLALLTLGNLQLQVAVKELAANPSVVYSQ